MELPSRTTNEDGFSLIEVIVSMVVLAILSSAVVLVLGQSMQASRTSKQRVVAANVVAAQMDLIRDKPVASLPVGVTTLPTVTVDGINYSIVQTVRWVPGPDAATDSCSGTGTSLYKTVQLVATWPNMSGAQPVRSDTVLTPDLGDVGSNSITIPIRVRDRNNNPEPGVAVQLAGGSVTTSQITDSYGCVLFGNVPAGTYTATTTSSGTPTSVNWQGNTTNTLTGLGTSVGGTWLPTTEFQWDTAAALTLTPTAPDNQHPVPAGVGATIANTSLTTPGRLALPTTGSSVVDSTLFPFTSGYQAWAGTCADSDPQSNNGTRAAPATTNPGGTGSVALTTRAVNVTVTGNLPASGSYSVQAYHPADSGCSAQTLPLGAVSNTARTLGAGMPYGTWYFLVTVGNRYNFSTQQVTANGTNPINVSVSAP